jgi:hypothetical protein
MTRDPHDKPVNSIMLALAMLLVAGYVAWRFFTCCIDSWADFRAGRIPPWIREMWRTR